MGEEGFVVLIFKVGEGGCVWILLCDLENVIVVWVFVVIEIFNIVVAVGL